jgi:hypothetical protein
MLGISRQSKWTFITAGNAGINIDIFAVSGGQIVLSDPKNKVVRFNYGGAGAGIGLGFKLPKVGKIEFRPKPLGKAISGAVGPESFPNHGIVYITEFFKGAELAQSDISGACMFIDGGAGLVAGYSTTIMLLGIDPTVLVANLALPLLDIVAVRARPNAVLLIRGPNVGLQFGAGVAGFLGYVG